MKKLNYILFSLLALLFVTSCEEPQEENPVLQSPTEFVLNVPVMHTQYIELSPETTLKLTCSQPDYGYAAAADYYAQVSLTESFTDFVEINEEPYHDCGNIQLNGEEVALAMCTLRGVTTEEDYVDEPAGEIFVRLRACLPTTPDNTTILSNVVSFTSVKGYFALKLPGYIYLVGAPEGWAGPSESAAAHYEDWKLYESSTAIGSKIYSGVFDIPAGSAMFRFYTALTGWDGGDSYGAQEPDEALEFELEDGVYSGEIVKGKGSFSFPNWEGGSMKITVDMSGKTFKLTVEAGGVDTNGKAFIYLVGAPEGWAGPTEDQAAHYESWKLYDLQDNGVYTGTFNVEADKFEFRFYTALTGWDADSYGAQEPDEAVEIALDENGVYSGDGVKGKGSWKIPGWEGGKVAISVDTVNNKVTFTKK